MTAGAFIETERLRATLAGPDDVSAVQAVLEATPAYHCLTEGKPAGPEAGLEIYADAEADADRLLWLLRLREGGLAAGLLDVQLHWPEPGAAHVRLLLVRQTLQGRGLGREAAGALEALLREQGFRALRLSVTGENTGARAFWERVGYAEAAFLEDRVTVFEKLL